MMARLIDADALKERAIRVSTVKEHCYMKAVGTHEIDKAPTVSTVPVAHGHWAYYSTTMQECSNCHRHTARHKFKYCPHCGAVMEDKYHESTD